MLRWLSAPILQQRSFIFFSFCLLLVVVTVAAVLVSWPCFLAILVELRGPSALIFATLSLALGLLVHRNNF
jgi:hypothetical protein